jgi:hypothetical protein
MARNRADILVSEVLDLHLIRRELVAVLGGNTLLAVAPAPFPRLMA